MRYQTTTSWFVGAAVVALGTLTGMIDPKRVGPSFHGGPFRIQVWRRGQDDTLRRTYAGEGPAFSPELGAWLVAVDEGRRLRFAEKPLRSFRVSRGLREEDLDRDLLLELEVRRRDDDAEPADTERAVDAVLAGEHLPGLVHLFDVDCGCHSSPDR